LKSVEFTTGTLCWTGGGGLGPITKPVDRRGKWPIIRSPFEVVQGILAEPTDLAVVSTLVADDVTYVSLNYDNPNLKKPIPWAGNSRGPGAIVKTFVDVRPFWSTERFEIKVIFGSGENVAVFGSMTYRSIVLGKHVTSPFAVLAKLAAGDVTQLQFMEDTFATSSSSRSDGAAHFRSNPDGSQVTVGADGTSLIADCRLDPLTLAFELLPVDWTVSGIN
jgi:ketosteroid isomerase-like protein